MEVNCPRVLLAGTNSGCGKTTVVCGILQALKNRKRPLASFKCGPDYIDPMFHSRIIGTQSRNLDLHFFPENTLRYLLAKNSRQAEISIIEGVMGYYDGIGLSTKASSYEVAKCTKTPVVLVVNARGAANSLLAVVHGFRSLHPDSGIQGVIFNNCSGMLYPSLKKQVEAQFGDTLRPLGYLPPMPDCRFESRHLGLVTAQEITDLQEMMQILAIQVEKSIELGALLALAQEAPPLSYEPLSLPEAGKPLRIAVAQDAAFCFYYADSLELLEELGAELVPFSPLRDTTLPPDIHGLYLGGGYPELYPEQLEKNIGLRREILAALQEGLPCIAECGGFLYLQQSLLGKEMLGFLPGAGYNTGKLSRFGYVTLTAKKDNLLCQAGEAFPAHEFHYYDVESPGDAFTAKKASGKNWDCAVADEKFYGGFPHFHFYAKPQMASRFLAVCRKEKEYV